MDDSGFDSDNLAEFSEIEYVPECDNALKPKIGITFQNVHQCDAFYRAYGAACGFETRKSTIKRGKFGQVLLRYLVCSREGKNITNDEKLLLGGKRKRRRSSCRNKCKARVAFQYKIGVGFVLYKFIEGHNHELASNGYQQHMRVNKKIDYGHHMFLARCAKANVGASRAFRLFKQMVGSYEKIGCKRNDFKNMYRDIKAKAVEVDSQLLLEKFRRLSQKNTGFFYSYFEDEDKDLTRLFWADSVAIENYKIFGDAVSFDATYSTNRYCMIFTPFTGKDNHGKCVNFGAGLIKQENAESYAWLLSKFVECTGSAPKMLITDQDRGIKAAVENVLPDTRHRLCMWHIMMKLGEKVSSSLKDNEDFIQKYNQLIWSELYVVSEFEAKWHEIMNEFDLNGNKWFESMYEIRSSWIPAYFHDVQMSGLFRTTSMSESENSFFRRYMNKNANLSELYMHFELAIETQSDDHDAFSLVDQSIKPRLITKLQIERHTATVYTNNIFLDVQNEIELAVMFCNAQEKDRSPACIIYDVDENDVGMFTVTYKVVDEFMSCACNYFLRHGLVCRHMFAVMKALKYNTISDAYIKRRWTQKACQVFEGLGQNRYASNLNAEMSDGEGVFGLACNCVGMAAGNEEMEMEWVKLLTSFSDKYSKIIEPLSTSNGKDKVIEHYYGSTILETADVGPPKQSKNKGSCSRPKSKKEAAIERSKKPLRQCKKCMQWGHHDSRNCDKVNVPNQ